MWQAAQILQAARELGLDDADGGAAGEFEGQRVSVKVAYDSNARSVAVVRGWLSRPLELGLTMRRREVARLDDRPGASGNADLDAEFAIRGDERTQLRALFCKPLCAQLLALHRASQELQLDDTGCAIFLPSIFAIDDHARWVERSLHAVATTVALLDEARVGVPMLAAWRPHAEALQAFAAARGLHWGKTPLLTEGRLDERALRVGARRSGRRAHHLRARLAFASPLALGLALRREGLLDGLRTAFGGQDIQVGDAAFDRRFLIRAEPAHAARTALLFDPLVRAQLLEIDHEVGALQIGDEALVVEPIRAECPPGKVVGMIDALAELAARIERNLLHGAEQTGPYR